MEYHLHFIIYHLKTYNFDTRNYNFQYRLWILKLQTMSVTYNLQLKT